MDKMIQAMAFFARNEEASRLEKRKQRLEKWKEKGKGESVIENTVVSPKQSRVIVSLNNVPVTEDMLKNGDQSIRLTNLQYALVYHSPGGKRYVKGMPFIIRNDLVLFCFRVSGYKQFLECAEKIPEIKWLAENTNICNELFDIAKFHVGIGIPIAFDAVAYAKKIGISIGDNSPFFGFKKVKDIDKWDFHVENKLEKGYYKKELKEVYSNGDDYEQENS